MTSLEYQLHEETALSGTSTQLHTVHSFFLYQLLMAAFQQNRYV